MAEPDYEYNGLMAQTWDLFRGDTSAWEDRQFYLELIRLSGEPVLDVGCGTGRILLDYLSAGVDIEGIDNSPEMLELCREKAAQMGLNPVLYTGRMESMHLPRQYQTILVPSSSFQLLLDPADAAQAMQRFHAHLRPGGMLVMPFMQAWKRGEPLVRDWHQTGEEVRTGDGVTLRRWSYSRFDPDTQLEHTQDRYEVIEDGKVIAEELHERSPATREYTRQQAEDLYQQAGFTHLVVYKGFTHEPAADEEELFTLTGRKPVEYL